MKKLIPFLLVVLFLFECKKSDLHDLSGNITLRGVVVFMDTLKGVTATPVYKNAKVYLKYLDSSGFMQSINANDQGQYSFSGIEGDQEYRIYAFSDTGAVKYSGLLDYKDGNFADRQFDTLKLYPSDNNQNGIHLIVRDSTGNRLPRLTAWIFNSPVLFAADTSAGKAFDMVTNDYGVDNKYNLAIDKYYARVKVRIGNVDLIGEDSVEITENGIKNLIVVLRSRQVPGKNGMELILNDIFNTPVYNANIYTYRTRHVWLLDTLNTNSEFMLQSDGAGLATRYIVDTGRYYFRMIKVISAKDTLRRLDSIDVAPDLVSKKTYTLIK